MRIALIIGLLLVAALGVPAPQSPAAQPALPVAFPPSAPPVPLPSTGVRGPARTSIAWQVAQAQPGDTVRVAPGIYREPTLVIDKPLTLMGMQGSVLDGGGERGLIAVSADDVTITGLTFRNTGVTFMEDRAALKFRSARQCRVEDNVFESTFFGIYLAEVDGCTIRGNTLRAVPDREVNGGNAIHSWHSKNLLIAGNTIAGHRDGIYLEFTEDSQVTGNRSSENLRYGLHFMFSDRCDYDDNTFDRNGAGVAVMYAEQVRMRGNRFSRSWGPSAFGLLLKEIKGGEVTGNMFDANSVALHVESTDRLDFRRNTFQHNGWAVRVMADARDNHFEANVFARNTFDVSTNSRRTSGSTFRANYWDRYQGYDLDRDSLGDKPFHPVRLYSLLVEQHEPALVLLRSAFVSVLDAMEAVMPVLTPEALVDPTPLMRPTSTNPLS